MTTDTTNPLPSIQEPVIDRDRRWSPVWYRWIKPLLETVKNSAGAVQEVVDNLAGTWALSVNQNNRVVGQIKLDGSAALSQFSVLADKLIVVHPSADGTTIQAFIVGLVDGVSTVGINGNLLVDGSILARSLFVDELSAISANIGDCTAGVVRSADNKFVIDLDNKTIEITA